MQWREPSLIVTVNNEVDVFTGELDCQAERLQIIDDISRWICGKHPLSPPSAPKQKRSRSVDDNTRGRSPKALKKATPCITPSPVMKAGSRRRSKPRSSSRPEARAEPEEGEGEGEGEGQGQDSTRQGRNGRDGVGVSSKKGDSGKEDGADEESADEEGAEKGDAEEGDAEEGDAEEGDAEEGGDAVTKDDHVDELEQPEPDKVLEDDELAAAAEHNLRPIGKDGIKINIHDPESFKAMGCRTNMTFEWTSDRYRVSQEAI